MLRASFKAGPSSTSASGYSKLGLPSSMTPSNPGQVNTELGIAFHSDSAFLRGILTKTSATTRANVNGAIFCARSDNDTGNNPHNPMYGINRAGADGDLVTLIGSTASESGGNSAAPMSQIDPTKRPTKVDRASDATGLVDTGQLVSLLNQTQASQVATAAEQISAIKLAKIAEDPSLESQILCNYTQTADMIGRFGNPDVLNPNLDTDIVGAGRGSSSIGAAVRARSAAGGAAMVRRKRPSCRSITAVSSTRSRNR